MTTPRRRRMWSDRFIDEITLTGAIDEELLFNPGDLDIGKGSTLVRMIGDLSLAPNADVSGSTNSMILSLGIGLVSPEVVEGSIQVGLEGELPMSGWLWRRRLVIQESNPVQKIIEFDIRAQRRLMYGEPRLFISNDVNVGTTFSVRTNGLIRVLYLLP